MSDYYALTKIIDKEVISVKELHKITNDELVAELRETASDPKRKFYFRYEVKLTNGEIYFVFIKKPWYMILFGDKKDEHKKNN